MAASLCAPVVHELTTPDARSLHNAAERLSSSCGIGSVAHVPQLVFVGTQSAGKSSVLAAISHLRFAAESDARARFATEFVLRRAAVTRVRASVGSVNGSEVSTSFQKLAFAASELADVVHEARERMGPVATGHVLRLEVDGPDMDPLTLVELPALVNSHFQKGGETAGQKGEETADQPTSGEETGSQPAATDRPAPDEGAADKLIDRYLAQKNSIVVVVVAATDQLVNHVALCKAKEHDPDYERTLGVITKPDLSLDGYAQVPKGCDSAHRLKLGWHVLRNAAGGQDSWDARNDAEERFFKNTAGWNFIRPLNRGAANLRAKLSKALYGQMRISMHSIVREIEATLRDREKELEALGIHPSGPEGMRSRLISVASEFQRLVRDGIQGRYSDAFFGEMGGNERKLRATLRNLNRVFDHVLETRGSKLAIVRPYGSAGATGTDHVPDLLASYLESYPYSFADPEHIAIADLEARLRMQAALNQGCELPGSLNRDLAIRLFQEQASPWRGIAALHIEHVSLVAKAFVERVLLHLLGFSDTNPETEAILTTYVDPFFARKEQELAKKLDEILRPYEGGYAAPLDAEFRRGVSRRWFARSQGGVKCLEARAVAGSSKMAELDDGDFGTFRTVDMMETYYEVSLHAARPRRDVAQTADGEQMSRHTFGDNVVNLVVEGCLIQDLPGILTIASVYCMTTEQLMELTSDSSDVHSRRTQLRGEIDMLWEGLEQCRKHRPRGITGELDACRRGGAMLTQGRHSCPIGASDADHGHGGHGHTKRAFAAELGHRVT